MRLPCRPETFRSRDYVQNGLHAKAFHEAVGLTGIVLTKPILWPRRDGFAIEDALGVPAARRGGGFVAT